MKCHRSDLSKQTMICYQIQKLPASGHELNPNHAMDPVAFGLLNPDEVILGVHLIAGFNHGGTEKLLHSEPVARGVVEKEEGALVVRSEHETRWSLYI